MQGRVQAGGGMGRCKGEYKQVGGRGDAGVSTSRWGEGAMQGRVQAGGGMGRCRGECKQVGGWGDAGASASRWGDGAMQGRDYKQVGG